MSHDEKINSLTIDVLDKIDKLLNEVLNLPMEERHLYSIGKIGRAKGLLTEFQLEILKRNPDLKLDLPIDYVPIPSLSKEEKEIVNNITKVKLELIDNALLTTISDKYLKVALIIALVRNNSNVHIEGLSESFYVERIMKLIDEKLLVVRGDIKYIRFSEIKLSKN